MVRLDNVNYFKCYTSINDIKHIVINMVDTFQLVTIYIKLVNLFHNDRNSLSTIQTFKV
jgi:hypothetical protein